MHLHLKSTLTLTLALTLALALALTLALTLTPTRARTTSPAAHATEPHESVVRDVEVPQAVAAHVSEEVDVEHREPVVGEVEGYQIGEVVRLEVLHALEEL